MAHPDADTPVDPAYFLMSYNLVKCAQCGVPWDEHARDLACDRYRPPAGLGVWTLPEVKNIVAVNLNPDSCSLESIDHEMQPLRCNSAIQRLFRFVRLLCLVR